MKQTAANMNPNKPGKLVRPWKWRWSHLYSQSFPLMTTLYLQTGWADTIKLHKRTFGLRLKEQTWCAAFVCMVLFFVVGKLQLYNWSTNLSGTRDDVQKTNTLHPVFKKCLSMAQPQVYSILARCHVSRGISVTPNTYQSHLMNFGHISITKHL